MGISDAIREAASQVLKTGGFVIFDDGNELEYVQYSKEGGGLMLMWPADGPNVTATDPRVASLLDFLGVRYAVESDGIYAQFGTDLDLIENFTTAAFERVYGRLGLQKLNVRVDA